MKDIKIAIAVIVCLTGLAGSFATFMAWADGRYQLSKEARTQAVFEEDYRARQEAVHKYDFYDLRLEKAQMDLISLEMKEQGRALTPTEKLEQTNLRAAVTRYRQLKNQAEDIIMNTSNVLQSQDQVQEE